MQCELENFSHTHEKKLRVWMRVTWAVCTSSYSLWGGPPGLRSCPCWWRRGKWIWPSLPLPVSVCSMTFLEWPLSSLVTRQNRTITWLFSLLSQILDGFSRPPNSRPFVHPWDRSLDVDSQLPVVLVSLAFSSCSRVGLVLQYELVQVSALIFRPPNCHFRFAVRVLFLKSLQDRSELVLFRVSQKLYCPMMIMLFLRLSMSCTAKCYLHYDVGYWQQVKLFFRHQSLLLWWK